MEECLTNRWPHTSMRPPPIVIVGAGPAGLTTALSLARWAPALAARILVLDKALFPREKICAGALGERGWRVLRELQASPDVPGVEVRGFQVLSSGPSCQARHPVAIGRVIQRLELDAALVERATALGIRIEQGVRVEGLEERPDRVIVQTSRGELEASVVVGADGVGSAVRRSMTQPTGGARAQVVEAYTEPTPDDPPRDLLCFDVSDHSYPGYSWHFPALVEGRPMVCRGVYLLKPGSHAEEGWAAPNPPVLHTLFTRMLEARGLPAADIQSKRLAERGFHPDTTLVESRRLLVGEAAGIDPLAGEGLAQSIEYGALAGRFLARSALEPAALAGWTKVVTRSRLGWDLALCYRLLPHFYGPQRRRTEAAIFSHDHVLAACLERFTGRLPGPLLAARAVGAMAGAWLSGPKARAPG